MRPRSPSLRSPAGAKLRPGLPAGEASPADKPLRISIHTGLSTLRQRSPNSMQPSRGGEESSWAANPLFGGASVDDVLGSPKEPIGQPPGNPLWHPGGESDEDVLG
jgi:hypothetical protein